MTNATAKTRLGMRDEICQTCWTRFGRSLDASDCLCSPDATVLTPSQFHAWNATRLEPLPEKPLDAPKPVYVMTPERLQFGAKPEKEKKKR